MREAYLTGGNEHFAATDATEPTSTELDNARMESITYLFESVALTEEYNLKLVGGRYTFACTDEFTVVRNQKPHPELLRVLRKLTLHMCLLTEQLTPAQLYPQPGELPADTLERLATQALREGLETGEAYVLPLLENYRCTAVAWKSKGVVLSGEKKARYRCFGKSLKVETPTTTLRYGVDELELAEGDYPFFELLYNTLNELRAELTAYLEGKYGEGGEQLLLFGRDPEPTRTLAQQVDDFVDFVDTLGREKGITVSVGRPGEELHELGKGKKSGKKGAANDE